MAVETSKEPGIFISWKVITLVILSAGAIYYFFLKPPAPDLVHWVSIEEGERQWQLGQKPVLYDFCASWCGPCKALRAEVFGDRAIAAKINQYFIPVMVMDRSHEDGRNPDDVRALDDQYGVHDVFPTLVVRLPGDRYQVNVGYGDPDLIVRFLQGSLALWNQAVQPPSHS